MTVQAEGTDAFSQFHLYVCSAFLVKWSKKLQEMDFQVSSIDHTLTFDGIDWSVSIGNYHVPSITSDTDLDRPRYRAFTQ